MDRGRREEGKEEEEKTGGEGVYMYSVVITQCHNPGRKGGGEKERVSHRVFLADIIWFEVVAASLVDGHLAGLTAVSLTSKTPDTILTLVTIGHLRGRGRRGRRGGGGREEGEGGGRRRKEEEGGEGGRRGRRGGGGGRGKGMRGGGLGVKEMGRVAADSYLQ